MRSTYQKVADALRESRPKTIATFKDRVESETVDRVAMRLAMSFVQDNPRFSDVLFLAAAGVTER